MISVIVPAKNEERTIERVLKSLKKKKYEIIVVDGHSFDKTREISKIHAHKVLLDNKKGKGDALRIGAENANGEILVFFDADGSHNASHIEKLVEPIIQGKAHLMIASRLTGGSDEFYGNIYDKTRLFFNKFSNLLINLRFGSKITDSQNGFRAIRKDKFQELNLVGNGFSIEQEMTMKAIRSGYLIKEIPSFEKRRKFGKSNISYKVWPELFFGFFKWYF